MAGMYAGKDLIMEKREKIIDKITVRRANKADSKDLWVWRNDPATRKNSIDGREISWQDHSIWYEQSLDNAVREIFIGVDEDTGESVGVVRFDIDEKGLSAEVSINLNPGWRNKGVSSKLLNLAIDEIQRDLTLVLVAEIKPHNLSSIKCFEKSGFALDGEKADLLVFKNKQGVINAIEHVRSTNNVNWMDLMRLAFRVAPKEAKEIVGHINNDDGKIAALLKRLGE